MRRGHRSGTGPTLGGLVLLIGVACGGTPGLVTVLGEEATVQRGPTKATLGNVRPVDLEMRVLGINRNKGKPPFNLAGYFFVVTPQELSAAAWRDHFCERRAVEQATMINVVLTSGELQDGVDRLAKKEGRVCARLSGYSGVLESLESDGRSVGKLTTSGGSIPFDPNRFLLLERLEQIPCD